MTTKHRLAKWQRGLLRKARLGLVRPDFRKALEAMKPEDWMDLVTATFVAAKEKYGWRFGGLYAGYLVIYSEKRPRRDSDREAKEYRALLARLEARRKPA